MEQEEYTKEEINWSYIEFVDNQDVLDLIEKVFSFSIVHLFNSRIWCFIIFHRFQSIYLVMVKKWAYLIYCYCFL